MSALRSTESVVRFWSHVDRTAGASACWPWTGGVYRGRGIFSVGKSCFQARRVAWEFSTGEVVPRNQHVETSCGNPLCCNPEHLLSPRIEDRFWRLVRKGDPTDCWPWTSTRTKRGYGQFRDRTRHPFPGFAHRYAYERFYGEIGDDALVVMHTCDNPPCCNPAHLRLGTHADNNRDMWSKGRGSRGAKHAAAVRAARERAKQAADVKGKEP